MWTAYNMAQNPNWVEGHGFSRAKRQRAEARYLLRWFIRAKYSSFTTPDSPVILLAVLPGVSRAHTSSPNSENAASSARSYSQRISHLNFSNSESRGLLDHPIHRRLSLTIHESRFTHRGLPASGRLTSHAVLPETVERVETHVSHRKQKTGYSSTRDSSRPAPLLTFFQLLVSSPQHPEPLQPASRFGKLARVHRASRQP
jgi:hypothetical protein